MKISKADQEKIEAMTEGGAKMGKILQDLCAMVKPGLNLLTIEETAQKEIKRAGGTPSFMTVQGYQWATCLCINEDVVHGIPVDYVLAEGDVLTIDIGMIYKGFHTDTAWTVVAGDGKTKPKSKYEQEVDEFLSCGQTALTLAISAARPGNHIGHISQAIEQTVTGGGYSIIKALVGHTVGRELHEKPQVPGFLRGTIEKTPLLVPGMTLALEVIYAMGRGDIAYANDDGWTLTSRDGSLTAVFEHTIAILENGPQVLTRWQI